MRYKCLLVQEYENWLTLGKIYEAELVVEFGSGDWIEIRKADDGHKAFARSNQFTPYRELDSLGV